MSSICPTCGQEIPEEVEYEEIPYRRSEMGAPPTGNLRYSVGSGRYNNYQFTARRGKMYSINMKTSGDSLNRWCTVGEVPNQWYKEMPHVDPTRAPGGSANLTVVTVSDDMEPDDPRVPPHHLGVKAGTVIHLNVWEEHGRSSTYVLSWSERNGPY